MKMYVRLVPKNGATSFYRCGLRFDNQWREVEVDEATIARLKAEQMLEVSDTLPEGAVALNVGNAGFVETSGQSANNEGAAAASAATAEDRHLAIVSAARDLPRDIASNFTNKGAPKTEVLSTVLGYEITAAERDAAWSVVMQEGRL